MQRSSAFLKCLRATQTSLFRSAARGYQYQTEIYTSQFPSSEDGLIETLSKEVAAAAPNHAANSNLHRFVRAYQQHGFRRGAIDPLNLQALTNAMEHQLAPNSYGLEPNDTQHSVTDLLHATATPTMTVPEIHAYLDKMYSRNMTIEFDYIGSEEEKLWIAREFEQLQQRRLDDSTKMSILKILAKSQAFDLFLGMKFPTFKRYSLEGGESSMAFYEAVFSNAAKDNIEDLVMGIAHRGRLNLMICMLNLDAKLLFAKMKGKLEFARNDIPASVNGDITHHYPCSTDLKYGDGQVHVSLLPNPSHLEAVDPLVLGKARSKQMMHRDGYYANNPTGSCNKVATFLIHGDAAFAGQGIVHETFQLSRLPNYAVGGTIHLLVNNQVGFTAPSCIGRSGNHNSDLAKAFDCPVIHVNGDYPELAYKAGEFAVKYRQRFGKDIVVDLVCFRRHGHNEVDDPTLTQPLMYERVHAHKTVPNMYIEQVIERDQLITKSDLDAEIALFRTTLDMGLNAATKDDYVPTPRNTYLQGHWSAINPPSSKELTSWQTGCNNELLQYVGVRSVTYPSDFTVHPTIERTHVKRRIERVNAGKDIDWSTAEALALGSLLLQQCNVRISGQDVGRGTFSHRHAMLVDQKTNKAHIPLNNLHEEQKHFIEVCNSNLSEEAVMGFDYGFSLDHPNNLVIWEAQFGDFFNGAQIIIDTFINSAEVKWMHQSAFVMLLPHGFDGAGPDHSSCRLERFLQMCSSREDAVDSDDVNVNIVNPTTPANYFHLLRRQMMRSFRKPLIVASPKTLIRLPECVSTLDEMAPETSFQAVLNDPRAPSKASVKRVIFVCGKHYYTLEAERARLARDDVALVRIEELCPFPAQHLRAVLSEYSGARDLVWAQEEHRNMGAWTFVAPRFERILGVKLAYAGRDVHCSVTGTGSIHNEEVKRVLAAPFAVKL